LTESAIEYLTLDDLARIAARTVAPAQLRVRDLGALAAAADRPRTIVFGDDAYPTLALKASALLHSIVRNHPLVDGDKRLGWVAARAFCAINGHDLRITSVDDAEGFVIAVARGEMDVESAAAQIAAGLRPRPNT
jgi:death-on-curing protein